MASGYRGTTQVAIAGQAPPCRRTMNGLVVEAAGIEPASETSLPWRRGKILAASVTCVRLVVHGAVQGVGFRFAASEAACACPVTGWVRNLSDGTVEIVAQGSPDAIARMTAWARRGPRFASVDRVVFLEQIPCGVPR